MTIGEIARLFNEHFGLGATLEVVKMEGWRRDMYADATDLPWVMPSPNMPTLDTAIVYPGTVLFEGILISEGRGTTRPFELIGAPWIEAESFARRMNALEPARRAFQTCGVRADLPETREADVRRLPDSRHGPQPVSAGAGRAWRSSRCSTRSIRAIRMAAAAVRVRTRQDADRHPRRLGLAATQIEGGAAPKRSRRAGSRTKRRFETARTVPHVLTFRFQVPGSCSCSRSGSRFTVQFTNSRPEPRTRTQPEPEHELGTWNPEPGPQI